MGTIVELWTAVDGEEDGWRNTRTGDVLTAAQIASRGRRFTVQPGWPVSLSLEIDGPDPAA